MREGLMEFLSEEGYQVMCAADGEAGLAMFRENIVHLVILDIMLPKMDGIELLTAMTDERTQVKSFDELADDYICKPFSLILLKKRVEALLRRNYTESAIWTYGNAVVDFAGYSATYEGRDAQVKPKEIKLLAMLVEHAGQVLSREQILNQIWGEEGPFDRIVDVYVKNLRKKLHLDCVVTVKGVGYKIEL